MVPIRFAERFSLPSLDAPGLGRRKPGHPSFRLSFKTAQDCIVYRQRAGAGIMAMPGAKPFHDSAGCIALIQDSVGFKLVKQPPGYKNFFII